MPNMKDDDVASLIHRAHREICLEQLCEHHGYKHILNLVVAVFIYGRKSVLCWEWDVMEAFRTLNCMDL
jgi:hypothetical protein